MKSEAWERMLWTIARSFKFIAAYLSSQSRSSKNDSDDGNHWENRKCNSWKMIIIKNDCQAISWTNKGQSCSIMTSMIVPSDSSVVTYFTTFFGDRYWRWASSWQTMAGECWRRVPVTQVQHAVKQLYICRFGNLSFLVHVRVNSRSQLGSHGHLQNTANLGENPGVVSALHAEARLSKSIETDLAAYFFLNTLRESSFPFRQKQLVFFPAWFLNRISSPWWKW